ncbi:MAG: PorP/SprF family type IX secretion system membrane protein [Bacteroidia bacterium]|nr:PorP/SprF family type IX secretion system membrane protein [Bacteroidia bacterium]
MGKIKYIFILFVFGFIGNIGAQISSRLDQFYLDPSAFNPAALGLKEQAQVNLFYNKSYSGMPGSPQNILANAALPGKNGRTGFGLYYLRESAGFGQLHNAYASYSYAFPVAEEGKLSFGVSAGVLTQNFDASKAIYISSVDPIVNALMFTPASTRADLRASAFFSLSGLNLGIAASRLTTPKFDYSYYNYGAKYSLQNIANFYISYDLKISENATLKPAAIITGYNMNYLRWQANLSWYYQDKFWLGFNAGDASHIGFNLGIKPHDGVKIGYQFSVPAGLNSRIIGNTHEFYTGILLGSLGASKNDAPARKTEQVQETTQTVQEPPKAPSREYKMIKVSRKAQLEQEGLDLDTSGILIQPLDSTKTVPGIYLVVGLHSEELKADLQIKQLYMQGFFSWKFYDQVNKSYYVYIRQFSSRAEASRFIMNNDTGLPQAWIREVN